MIKDVLYEIKKYQRGYSIWLKLGDKKHLLASNLPTYADVLKVKRMLTTAPVTHITSVTKEKTKRANNI